MEDGKGRTAPKRNLTMRGRRRRAQPTLRDDDRTLILLLLNLSYYSSEESRRSVGELRMRVLQEPDPRFRQVGLLLPA